MQSHIHFAWWRKLGRLSTVARALKNTVGESPAKRVRKTHRGRRCAAGQKKRDQRNERYYPGSFAFAWLAQNYGTANCNVASTRDVETERGIVGAGETTAGIPQDSWEDSGRANEPDGKRV